MRITRRHLRQIIREEVVKIGSKHGTEFYRDPDPTDDPMALRYMSDAPYSVGVSSDIMDVGTRVDNDPDLDDDGLLSVEELINMIHGIAADVD